MLLGHQDYTPLPRRSKNLIANVYTAQDLFAIGKDGQPTDSGGALSPVPVCDTFGDSWCRVSCGYPIEKSLGAIRLIGFHPKLIVRRMYNPSRSNRFVACNTSVCYIFDEFERTQALAKSARLHVRDP